MSTQADRILGLIKRAGRKGMTCDEVESATGYLHQSASAALNRLLEEQRLDVVQGVRRRARTGRKQRVYIAPDDPDRMRVPDNWAVTEMAKIAADENNWPLAAVLIELLHRRESE